MMDALQRALPANLYASKVGTVIGVSTLFAVIAVVAVILRFKCRSMVKAKIGIDDWLILAALPIAIADAITVSYTTRAGLGRHVEVVPASDLAQGGKLFFTVQLLWIFSSGLVKLSILAFYLRIFSVLTYVRACAWFLIGITTAWLISMPIAHGLQCIPVEKIWDSTVPGHCLDTVLLYLIGSIVDVVVDFLILLLPIPAIFKLQMPMPKKLSVLIIFIIGGLTCVLSLIRFTGAYSVIYNRADLTWVSWEPLVWAVAEPCLGTLCACLPVLQPLLQLATGSTKKGSIAGPNYEHGLGNSGPSWKNKVSRERDSEIRQLSQESLQRGSGEGRYM